ncbi:MAG: hypothetical protein P1U44_02170 [Vicingaceae bacterium]|nr:hypothetical protein [Vicingaceae bacterium]
MNRLVLTFLCTLFLFSCKEKVIKEYKIRVVSFGGIDEEVKKEGKLVVESLKDTIRYKYYFKPSNNDNREELTFEILKPEKNDSILIHKIDSTLVIENLVAIKNYQINGDLYQIKKYQEENPVIDGDGATFFNDKYGKIAGVSYSWGFYDFIQISSDSLNSNFEIIKKVMLDDTSGFFRYVPKPPQK